MKYYALTFSLGLLLGSGPTAHAQAQVGKAIPNPEYVNLYWDSTWDTDNPSMTQVSIDSFTAAIVSSTYFAGLREYGVTNPSFGGGFLPAAECGPRSPSRPGFAGDPFSSSISGFLSCELDHGGVPKGPNVIYNIILPAYAIEQDGLGVHTFCGSATAWHFYLPAVFTLTMTSSMCSTKSTYTDNLLHEMIEAATDPFPPARDIDPNLQHEIADMCEGQMQSNPFKTPGSLGEVLAGGNAAPPFTTNITLSGYRSNQKRECITGYSDQTVPTSLTLTLSGGQGGTASMTIKGSGFGTLPPAFQSAAK